MRKLMQHHDIKASGKRKFVVTIDDKYDSPIAPNLLARNFIPTASTQTWRSDITDISTNEEPYLSAVIYLFNRQVVVEHAVAHAGLRSDRCLTHCMVSPTACAKCDLSFESGQSWSVPVEAAFSGPNRRTRYSDSCMPSAKETGVQKVGIGYQ